MPFVAIMGRTYEGSPSWTTPAERNAALNRWVARIGKEVGAAYSTKSERDAAAEFVRAHRLSIACAFTKRIVRADVVLELTRLFQLEIESKADDPL